MIPSRRTLNILNVLALAGMLVAIYMAMIQAPFAINLTETDRWAQRIIYFHVPSAWSSMLSFLITFIASIIYLARGGQKWDIIARSSAELGIFFTVAAIVSGSIWARPAWNTWWTWDPRLTTYTIVLLLYIAYFMLRNAMDDPSRRARFAAVYGIFAFLSVPITFMSIRWWNTIHPVIMSPEADFGLGPGMTRAFITTNIAFTLLYFTLLANSVRLAWTVERVAALRERILQVH
ncbi:MAG: cytochrome c biogenesis protein CcsA [Chloroflexi bacterium]|nr:cytochrome c biogenesis protein CcsA [Chloroflexota bacterium]